MLNFWSNGYRQVKSSAWLSYLTCLFLVTGVLFWRRPDAFLNPQFWAEDGNVFFTQAFFMGARSLVTPYAGYFHTLARLTAWVARALPVRYAPHAYNFASWGILALLIGYLFTNRFPFDNTIKWMLGAALVVNAVDNEVFFNLANWATISTFFWLLLTISKESASRRQILFDFLVLFLAGLNSPFVVCLWPLFLFRWAVRRTPHSLWLFILSLVVVGIQVWNMIYRIGGVGNTAGGLGEYFNAILFRFGFMFLGAIVYRLQLTAPLQWLGMMVFSFFYGGLAWNAFVQKNWTVLSLLTGALLAWMLSLYVMRAQPTSLIHEAGRHFYIPAVTTSWALILSTFRLQRLRQILLTMILFAFLFFTPRFKNQTFADLDWAEHTAQCVGVRPLCKIPTNPVWEPPVWHTYYMSDVFDIPVIPNIFSARFGGKIELLGYEVKHQGSKLTIKLFWHALEPMQTDYHYFVQIFSPDNLTIPTFQVERLPLDGDHPPTRWTLGDIITDSFELSVDTFPPGAYKMGLGWYDPNAVPFTPLVAHVEEVDWKGDRVIFPFTLEMP